MKHIDMKDQVQGKRSEGGLKKFTDGLVDVLAQVGITLEGEGSAQETINQQFGRLLDNRYTMLENVYLPDEARPIPMILIGPPGVVVINPRREAGMFRAREDTWVVMNQRTQEYEMASENLLTQTQAYAQAVETFLSEKGAAVVNVQPLLIFTNPGVHVESSRPAVRILPVDAIERYVTSLSLEKQQLLVDDIQLLIEYFSAPVELPVEPEPEKEPETLKNPPPLSGQLDMPPFLAKLKLTNKQWILLAIMVAFEILILIVLVIIVLMNA